MEENNPEQTRLNEISDSLAWRRVERDSHNADAARLQEEINQLELEAAEIRIASKFKQNNSQ